MELKPSRGAVTVHCTEAGSVAPACLPGHSQAHTPRGRPSPTATSAGSASGSPARRRRTGPTPGSSSPAGQPCVGGSERSEYRRCRRGKISQWENSKFENDARFLEESVKSELAGCH